MGNQIDKGREQLERLERLAALPDEAIDASDIPEITDWSGAIRLWGALRGTVKVASGTDLTEGTGEIWKSES